VNRSQFEHVARAAADVVDDDVVVIGSQAILAQNPEAPDKLLRSSELDVFPKTKLNAADQIDGALGDGSRFHETFGYYAHSVGPETLTAPAGWQDRLVRLELPAAQRKPGTVVAWCIEKHDLMLAKLSAGREHDLEFVRAAIESNLVDTEQLRLGVDLLPKSVRDAVRERLAAMLPLS
jgi:Nucleotidyltransferase of unknown function (DUF6036)